MRRDWEKVKTYDGSKTVWEVFLEDVPMGSINPEPGHNIVTKIIRRGKMLCKDYGSLMTDEDRLDDMSVKRVILRPEEVLIHV